MKALGTLDELPRDYVAELSRANLVPLWPSLRALLPPQAPRTTTLPAHWRWTAIRPLLLRAGELTPMEKAERRVLVLANPGRGLDNLQASATIYLGMQLVLPGETAPSHRHTPNAARIVVEGEGAVTLVDGEACAMKPGDLILTPTGQWHEHRHEGRAPVIWLDVLDLPLMVYLDVSYAVEGTAQAAHAPDYAYAAGGLAPLVHGRARTGRVSAVALRVAAHARGVAGTRRALRAGCAGAARLRESGNRGRLPQHARVRRTAAASRRGDRPAPRLGGARVPCGRRHRRRAGERRRDRIRACRHLLRAGTGGVRLANRSRHAPVYLVMADESPLQRKLGVYEQR